ncbi:DEAD/DEAH box helicase [Horticoccus luteus]|uniref:DEAD/DEAH box helicase n=1 Tax=Horticoccus luteus TaxID=2862869 RepID=A0A8F9XL04_9BACT|nr:DEAD/DEAH box helicase [Horticoccus luteus]QYM78716.1 DEAD/DEAH box helicase [Horticoccus luteus]
MSFTALKLSVPLLRAVAEKGYDAPTPIQAEAIPAVLRGADVWASAQTGSGKTAAFALPMLERLSAGRRPGGRFVRALVLVPTRELAAQVGEAFRRYGRFLAEPLKTLVVYGGVSINPQMMALGGGADILVATPGRLLDLVEHNAVSLGGVATLVLDEADRLLALGFAGELARIKRLMPAQRQTLLFSATFPPEVEALAQGWLREPVRVAVATEPESAPDIEQRAIEVDAPRRTQLLRHLIQTEGWTRVLVFVATKYATEHVAEKLRRAGLAAAAWHGELSQGARTLALADFKAGKLHVLVATDLAARGLDIAQLPVVVNYDLPRSPTDYTHRIGRTGRAGERGVAVSFVSAATFPHFRLIEKRQRLAIAREQIAGFEPVELAAAAPSGTGGVKGRRKSKKDKFREALARGEPAEDNAAASDSAADEPGA